MGEPEDAMGWSCSSEVSRTLDKMRTLDESTPTGAPDANSCAC